MKLADLFENLYTPNQSDKKAKEMEYPNVYKHKDIGSKPSVRREKVVVRSSGNKDKVYGMRTVVQKNT